MTLRIVRLLGSTCNIRMVKIAAAFVKRSIAAKMTNLQNFAFRICANFRRTLRPLFSFDYRDHDVLYADHDIDY